MRIGELNIPTLGVIGRVNLVYWPIVATHAGAYYYYDKASHEVWRLFDLMMVLDVCAGLIFGAAFGMAFLSKSVRQAESALISALLAVVAGYWHLQEYLRSAAGS